MRLMGGFEAVWGWIERSLLAVLVFLMAVLVSVTGYQVVSRYVFNRPLTWSEELSRYVFVWIVFLGAWVGFKHGHHLSIDLLVQRLPARWRPAATKLVDMLVLFLMVAVLAVTPRMLMTTSRQVSAALKLPMSYVYAAFPLCALLITVEIILRWALPHRSPSRDSGAGIDGADGARTEPEDVGSIPW